MIGPKDVLSNAELTAQRTRRAKPPTEPQSSSLQVKGDGSRQIINIYVDQQIDRLPRDSHPTIGDN
jgi:hypothetical protein